MATKGGRNDNGSTKEDSTTGNEESTVKIRNENIKTLDSDYLYHIELGTKTDDLVEKFGDVKFVCMGGAAYRMEHFAHYIYKELKNELPPDTKPIYLEKHSKRYPMYKIGPILAICHGIGVPSLQIILHEIIKLMYYAKIKDPVFFRIGTSGGIGITPGSVVISDGAVDESIQPYHEQSVAGRRVKRPAILNQELAHELRSLHQTEDGYELVCGKTMCSNDFYEGQGRLDGAFCDLTEADKMNYLKQLHKEGVRNIEMESTCFSALTNLAGIRAAILNVVFLDRLKGDQVLAPKEDRVQWEFRPQEIVMRYIKRHLSKNV